MVRCPRCESDLWEGSRTCAECGTRPDVASPKRATERTFQRALQTAKRALGTEQAKDTDVSTAAKLVDRSQAAWDDGQSGRALDLARAAKRAVDIARLRSRLASALETAQAHVRTTKESGVDTLAFERNLAQAAEKLKAGEYRAAQTLLRKASIRSLDARREKQVRSWIDRAAKKLVHARERGGDVSLAEHELDKARQAAKVGDVAGVHKAVDAATRAAEDARKFARVEAVWLHVNAEVDAARRTGVRPKESKRLLAAARDALKKGVYADVAKFAQLAKVALRDEKRYHVAESALKGATRELRKEERRGSDIREAARILDEASAALAEKDYPRVRSRSKEVLAELKVAAGLRKVEDSLASLSLDAEDLRRMGAETAEFDLRLKDAREAIRTGDLTAANRFIRAARHTAANAREARYRAIVQFTIERILTRAGEGTVDAAHAKELLAEVESALAGGRVVDVDALVEKRFGVKDPARLRQLSQRLVEVKEELLELRRADIDVSGAEEKLVRVTSLLSEGQYDTAEVMLQEIHEIADGLREALQESARDLLKKARETVERVKAQRVPVPDAVRILRNAEDASEQGKYYEAIEFARIAIHRAERALSKQVEEEARVQEQAESVVAERVHGLRARMEELRNGIDALSGQGVDVTAARDSLGNGRRALDQRRFEEAEAYLGATDEIVRSLGIDLRHRAEAALDSMRQAVEQTKAESLPTEDFAARLAEAEDALNAERYGAVLQIADSIQASIDEARLARAKEDQRRNLERAKKASVRFVRVRNLLRELHNADIDIAGSSESMREAERALQTRSFDDVDRLLDDLEETAKTLRAELMRAARDLIERARTRIADAEEIDLDMDEANRILGNAETHFGKGEFDDAVEFARMTEGKAEAAIAAHGESVEAQEREDRERARRAIAEVKKLVADLGRADIEIVDSKNSLTSAERALEEGQYDDVHASLAAIREMAESLSVGLKQAAEDLISMARAAVEKAKEEGLEVPRAEHVLGNADDAIRDSRYVEAIEYKKVIEDIVGDARRQETFKELVGRIQELREEIQHVAHLGADLSPTSGLLRRAEQDIELGRFNRLEEYAQEIAESIQRARQAVILTRLEAAKKQVGESGDLGLETAEAERELREATSAAERGDWEAFERLMGLVEGQVAERRRAAAVERAQEEIVSIEAMATQASKLGVEIQEVRAMLDEARRAMEEGNYENLEQLVTATRAALEQKRSRHLSRRYETRLEGISATLDGARRIGADVSESEQILQQGKDALAESDLPMADILVKQAEVSADIQIQNFIKNRYPNLVLQLPKTGLQTKAWNRYVFEVMNKGKLDARNVEIKFQGDVEVKGETSIPELRVDERKVVEIGLMPKREGDVPIDVQVFYQRYFDDNRYEATDSATMRVERAGTYLVEDVFLIHTDGRLVSHQSRKFREEIDEDIFSGMLTVVQDFVKDSFRSRTRVGLKRLDFGDSKILMERSPHTFLASVVLGDEPALLPVYMIEVLKEVEEKFGDRLERWSGMLHEIQGVDDIIRKLIFVTEEAGADLGELKGSTVAETAQLLASVQEIGGNSDEILKLLGEAETSLEEDLDASWRFIAEAKKKAMETKRQVRDRIEEMIDAAVRAVEELRNLGADVGNAELLIREARAAFESADYAKVREIADGIQETLGRAKDEIATRRIEEEMTGLFQEIQSAKAQGIDVREAEGYLARIQDAIENKDYDRFQQLVEEALGALQRGRRETLAERGRTEIDEIASMLTDAHALGVEAPEAAETLRQAEAALQAQRFEELQPLIDRARIVARSAIGDHLKDRYPRLFLRTAEAAMQAEMWNRFVVEVANKGNWTARDVQLDVRGDVEVQGLTPIEKLDPNERQTLEIGVRPRAAGTVPIDFQVFYRRPLDDVRYEATDSKEVRVEPAGTYRVLDALLFHEDGRLIVHERRLSKEAVPETEIAALRDAVTAFLKDRYGSPDASALARFDFKGRRVVTEHGPRDFLIAVVDGEEPPLLPLYMVEVLSEIETAFGPRLEAWSGRPEDLEGIEALVHKLLYVTDREGADLGPLEESSLNSVFRLSEQGLLQGEGDLDFVSWARNVVETQDYEGAAELVQRVARTVRIPQEQLSRAISEAVAVGRESGGLQVSDELLQRYVDIVRSCLEAVFRAKQSAGIEKYWPVKRLAIRARSPLVLDALTSFRKVVVGQSHAKELDLVDSEETWRGMNIQAHVDMDAITNSYRLWSKKIEILLKSQDAWKIKAALAKGGYNVGIEGQQVRIEPTMVSFVETLPETVIEEPWDGGAVYLDTEMTSDILAEGYAMEVVNIIKDIRRDLKLAEQVNIRTKIRGSDDLNRMLKAWRDYISRETNSLELDFVREPFRDGYVVEAQLGEENFLVSVKKLKA